MAGDNTRGHSVEFFEEANRDLVTLNGKIYTELVRVASGSAQLSPEMKLLLKINPSFYASWVNLTTNDANAWRKR